MSQPTSVNSEANTVRTRSRLWQCIVALLAVLVSIFLTVLLSLFFLNQPPKEFQTGTVVNIESGMSIRAIADTLKVSRVVRSSTLLYMTIVFFYEPSDIKASTYVFDTPLTSLNVAKRLATGDFDTNLLRFTHYEGERATDVAKHAQQVLNNFVEAAFLERAIPLEGKLYPDTYFIPKDYSADELIDLMLATFAKQIEPIQPLLDTSPLSNNEVLILASILEREANSTTSMKIVSGILQRRLAEGMPLQADASIEYILEKPLKELTPEDLKIDSPYNTYTNRGLPPTPIGNPGINAIMAVLEPDKTDYLYYITDENGEFHYATSYREHLENIERYLRQ